MARLERDRCEPVARVASVPVDARRGRQRDAPYGSWPTPSPRPSWWPRPSVSCGGQGRRRRGRLAETRPAKGGRTALVRRDADGRVDRASRARARTPRTAVHKYGGGAWWTRTVSSGSPIVSDQRLYRRDPQTGATQPLTPSRRRRAATGSPTATLSPDGAIVCVREHHPPTAAGRSRGQRDRPPRRGPSVHPGGAGQRPGLRVEPAWSPDGRRLCWLEWDHPNMPWDGTRLIVPTSSRATRRWSREASKSRCPSRAGGATARWR